jgi:uncharacterized protein (DUF305 family)
MSHLSSRALATSLVIASAVVGCSSRTEGVRASPEPAASPGRYPHTEADVQFMTDMIRHHAQALVMARWAPTHDASSDVRRLAERIINGQQDEIASMQRWLGDRGQTAPNPLAGTETHSEHHAPGAAQSHMPMPGMLTDEQMKELDQARGSKFDRLFLTYMIQHHQGAVTMVQNLFATPGAAREETTFKLASDISADQSSEIRRMQRMLAGLPSQAGSP